MLSWTNILEDFVCLKLFYFSRTISVVGVLDTNVKVRYVIMKYHGPNAGEVY